MRQPRPAAVTTDSVADVLDALADDWTAGSRRKVKGCAEDVRTVARLYRAMVRT